MKRVFLAAGVMALSSFLLKAEFKQAFSESEILRKRRFNLQFTFTHKNTVVNNISIIRYVLII